jgi:hypothetical protein
MLPLVVLFVWACACNLLVQSRRRWLRGFGGVVTVVGSLVCANALFHIV